MASGKPKTKKIKRKLNFAMIHRLGAGVALLAFVVVVVAGLRAEASIVTITFRAAVVVIVISLISRIVVSILVASEEMNSGQA